MFCSPRLRRVKKFIPSCSSDTSTHTTTLTSYIHPPAYLREAEGSAGLAAHHLSEPGLALDDAVGHAHLTAQRRQEQHDLQRIHIMSDHHQLGFLLLNLGWEAAELVYGVVRGGI